MTSLTSRSRSISSRRRAAFPATTPARWCEIVLPIDCSADTLAWHGVDGERLDDVIATTEAHDLYKRLERWDRYRR